MIAAIVDTNTLGKVVVSSLASGVGIAAIFGAGISSAGAFVDALRERRTAAGAAWAALAVLCVAGALGAVVLGIVVMTTK